MAKAARRSGGKVEQVKLIARMPRSLATRLKARCAWRGVTLQAAVEEAVREWLKRGRSRQ